MKLGHGLVLILLISLSAGCEQLGLENPAAEQAREEAEGKAIGGGCRQSGRSLEDCYQAHRRSSKAAIFAGWRDMDGYMRENKIQEISQPEEKAPVMKKLAPALEAVPAGNDKGAESKPMIPPLPERSGKSPLSH